MSKHLSGVMVAVFAAATLFTVPAFADHRPGNVVVMGGTISLTGRYAEPAGRILEGRKLYIDELNSRGGLLGHKIELKILDDKSDARTAIELYEKLITVDKVDLVLGPYSSYLTDPVANVMERYRRPFLAGGVSPVIYQRGRKYVFKDVPSAPAPVRQNGALALAQQIGVKRIAIIAEGSVFPRQVTEGALSWAKKLGLKVVLLESYRKGQTDFAVLFQRIKASGAEAIFSNSYFTDSIAQVRQLCELRFSVKLVSAIEGPALPKFVKELGSTAEYVVGFSSWEPKLALGYRGMKQFIDSYQKRYGVKPNFHAANGYGGMQVYEAAVKHAGSFNPEKIRDAFASIAVDTIWGRWKANEQGSALTGSGLTIQIQNGERIIVWPAHQAEARFLPMPKWEERTTN